MTFLMERCPSGLTGGNGHRAVGLAQLRTRRWFRRRCFRNGGATNSSAVNHQLESRMREIRTYGSAGGETGSTGLPYPDQTDPGLPISIRRFFS